MSDPVEDRERRGVAYGIAAYAIWGAVPLFWPLVKPAGALEVLAHRIIWSLLICVVLLRMAVPRGWWGRVRGRRTLTLLALASAVVTVNWGSYIWAVQNGHVIETALGYYINPIFSIVVGVIFLRERLHPVQWCCVGLAVAAVAVLTVDYGHLPWIALLLAVSFGLYGVIKKQINGGAVDTLVVESAAISPIALGYLIFLQVQGQLTFAHLGRPHDLLLVATGIVTVVPLLLFASAATRLPLSTLGLLQYLAPTIQFILGITYFGETMSTGRWIGFALVWLALVILTVFGVRQAARRRRAAQMLVTAPTGRIAG